MTTIGVLLPLPKDGPPQSPADSPLGRAAARLASDGLRIVFGSHFEDGSMRGFQARMLSWTPVTTPVRAIYDTFPGYSQPDAWRAVCKAAAGTPIANTPQFTTDCGDRLSMQRILESCGVRMTPLEGHAKGFARALESWPEGAYAKPRHRRSFKRAQFVPHGGPIPKSTDADPLVLQQSRGAPSGWGGMVVRVLAQRSEDGWVLPTPVAFRSVKDAVAGGASDAVVDPADKALPAAAVAKMKRSALATVSALAEDDPLIVEMGIDFAVDDFYEPWVIDVESKPKWGLLALSRKQPERWEEELIEAHMRPLRYLAAHTSAG